MGRRTRRAVAALLAAGIGTVASAYALTSKAQIVCQAAAAKAAAKFLAGELRVRQRCIDGNLTSPGSCAGPDPIALQKVRSKLDAAIAKKCAFEGHDAANLAALGYPGPCADANPGDGFTFSDLQQCLALSHRDALTGICFGGTNLGESCAVRADCPDTGPGTLCVGISSLQYDPEGFGVGPISISVFQCQRAVVRTTTSHLRTMLASIQKCRGDFFKCRLDFSSNEVVCRLSGFPPSDCAAVDPGGAIAKSAEQLRSGIRSKCSDADAATIGMCEPDQPTVETGIACLLGVIRDLVDTPDPDGPLDLIDFEYPE